MIRFFENSRGPKPPRRCREIERWSVPCGELIVFESMEEVFWERRTPPYGEGSEDRPIVRVVIERPHGGSFTPCTIKIEGLMAKGSVERTVEIEVPALKPGHSMGYSFTGWTTSIRLVGWWFDPEKDGMAGLSG